MKFAIICTSIILYAFSVEGQFGYTWIPLTTDSQLLAAQISASFAVRQMLIPGYPILLLRAYYAYLLVLLIYVEVFVVSGTDAKYGRGIYHGRELNFQRMLKNLKSCRHAGLTPCFGEIPVRCFSRLEKCNGFVFCRRYHDDELGCSGITNVRKETRTFTIRLTSTESAEQLSTHTETSYTTTTLTRPLTTYTYVSLASITSTTSLTPIIHPSNSMTTTSVTSEFVATVVAASRIAGFVAGPGTACENLAQVVGGSSRKRRGVQNGENAAVVYNPEHKRLEFSFNGGNVVNAGNLRKRRGRNRKKREVGTVAGANRYSLSIGNIEFTGTLLATVVCTQASIKI